MYIVIESTPGYLPENDDPATFDRLDDAVAYLRDEVERYLDGTDFLDGENVSWSDDESSCYVVSDSPFDLGRVFEIVRAAHKV